MTVTGGKWTTYRAMAEDVIEKCEQSGLIGRTRKGLTESLPLVGVGNTAMPTWSLALAPGWHSYGAEQDFVKTLPGAGEEICAGLTVAMVRFAARYEYALTVEDVLARRSRCLFLDARLASAVANRVGDILMQETNTDPKTEAFLTLANQYVL